MDSAGGAMGGAEVRGDCDGDVVVDTGDTEGRWRRSGDGGRLNERVGASGYVGFCSRE